MSGIVKPLHIYPDVDKCMGCSKRESCRKGPTELYMFDKSKPWVMIVGSGHGIVDDELCRPFVGPAGKRLRCIIQYIWNTTGKFNVAFTNTVRFRPLDSNNKDRVPNNHEIDECKSNLHNDIIKIKPNVIFTAGMSATDTLLPECANHSIASIHGIPFISETYNTTIIPIYHPSYIIRKVGHVFDKTNLKTEDKLLINDITQGIYTSILN